MSHCLQVPSLVAKGRAPVQAVVRVGCREGCACECERGNAVRYRQCCTRAFIQWIPLPFDSTCKPHLPVLRFPSPSPGFPHSLEAVRHKAVNHWIQAAVQAAQGHRDVIGKHVPRPLPQRLPSHSDLEVNQHLADVEGREAHGEDHQDSSQKSDGTGPSHPALVGQAVAGGEKTGDTQSEAHHSEQGEEKLQDGEIEEGRDDHAGGAELQSCGLKRRGKGKKLFLSSQIADLFPHWMWISQQKNCLHSYIPAFFCPSVIWMVLITDMFWYW